MKNIALICILAILMFLSGSCEKEKIELYQEAPTVYFSEYSRTYTFTENIDRIKIGFDTVKMPLQISGFALDHDREVIAEAVTEDTLHTAEKKMYSIAKGYVCAHEFKGYVPIRVNYSPDLDDSVYRIRVRLVANVDFPGVDLENNVVSISITNKITEPSNWHRIERYFGSYSNSWYRFILEKTGLSSIPYWSVDGSKDRNNPDPERWTMTLYELKAYAALVKEELNEYNRKHPHDHLKHEDGPEKGKEVTMP